VVSLVAASIALTILVDAIGIAGGAAVGVAKFGVSFDTYFAKAKSVLKLADIWTGLLKAACFGLSTAVVGCSEGLATSGGAAGVGRQTQKTVVISFVLVLVLDLLINFIVQWTGMFGGRA
jgi:phospholipid/cholesterol/gamma-HCH transport system permease protein